MNKILFIILSITTLDAWSLCQNYIDNQWPNDRYIRHNDGTVTDTQTKLMWKQCTEGQSASDCSVGSVSSYNWQQALVHTESINNNGGFAGHTDWRIPNIEELRSIVAYNCYSPAINLYIFPNSPTNAIYWSSSPYRFVNDVSRTIGLRNGGDGTRNRASGAFIRLIRTE
jgi:hypothetical protein